MTARGGIYDGVHGDGKPVDRIPGGGTFLRVFVDDRTYSILCAVSERTGRNVEDLCEAAISEEAIRSIPPQAR